ncbi:DUF4279 domain-containing protein [Hahella sp. KA22]|uniref:DUF4279 domain-containing protein n=1 Tax=Hahella sp. KA22 TaxID=1628392 RepID=UPI000FDE364E|nr:DUF4279 domain-containing protein [Hahella sp. KA22]AZZ93224.1 DUF4279 domain-containing protein [Hahella sp. KA22]QAY56598.1 DUF4279 domain-containing protein [Hahella sp. KA22]
MQDLSELIISVAAGEIDTPSLGVTEQVLASHKIARKPIKIDMNTQMDCCNVYYSLVGESYYFVLSLKQDAEQWRINWAYIEPHVRVRLVIQSSSLTPDRMSSFIGLKPTHSYLQGEKRNKSVNSVYRHHGWGFELDKDVPDSLEKKLDKLISVIGENRESLRTLSESASIKVMVWYDCYKDWMGGISLSAEQMALLGEIGAGLEVDIHASGPDWPGP